MLSLHKYIRSFHSLLCTVIYDEYECSGVCKYVELRNSMKETVSPCTSWLVLNMTHVCTKQVSYATTMKINSIT